ncbi:hypothetical protein Ancab_030612 [Ancistrocladus abbreviatus]
MAGKAAPLILFFLLGAVLTIGVHLTINLVHDKKSKEDKVNTSNKAIVDVCTPTSYKETCEKSLSTAAGNTSDPKELIKVAFKLAKEEITSALNKSKTIQAAANDPRAKQGLEICKEIIEYAVGDLERSVYSVGNYSTKNLDDFLEDLRIWVGGAATFQDACFDAFENATSDAGLKMRELFNTSRQLTSNALTMVSEIKKLVTGLNIPGLFGSRRLLQASENLDTTIAGQLPAWISDAQRNLMKTPVGSIKPDVVVAQDGSGKFKTIGEALALLPEMSTKPFIIYIKAGVYKEYVSLDKKKTNVVFIGDGPTKTRITGNRSFKGGYQTFMTSTVAITGAGFMARDIGFENSAGAESHQAVATRVVGDYSVFYNCHFDGYQDTLYPVRGRQFYRDCTISGTIDFIFGDAQAVFQNCKMVIRKPLEGQSCMVTAQGRSEPSGPGAIILQNCTITGDPADPLRPTNKAYLGRPWKTYSRTIIMQSNIENIIAPEGWIVFETKVNLENAFYAEHDNRGPGAIQTNRAKVPGIKNLTPQQAQDFTPDKFFKGSEWITPTGTPYEGGMMQVA